MLARATLALTLTDELPSTIVDGIINDGRRRPASSPIWPGTSCRRISMRWSPRQGPSFRDFFVADFMTNFSDDAHAAELRRFAPAQATSGGRVTTARALETIAIAADLKTRALPAIEVWIKGNRGKAR